MNNFIKIILIIGLLAVSHFAYAGSINHTFKTGDTLEASHLNDATTAINDNDARITTNATGITSNDTGIAGNAGSHRIRRRPSHRARRRFAAPS